MSIRKEITVVVTPDELAREFVEYGGREQANALEDIGRVFESWGPYCRDQQLAFIARVLGEHGRNFILNLAEEIRDL